MKAIMAALFGLALAGCQSGTPQTPATSTAPAPEAVPAIVGEPVLKTATAIALLRGDSKVHVGDSAEDAYDTLLGGRTGGFITQRLPQGFQGPFYTCKVWQGAEDGFGVIAYNGKVALGLIQENKATRDRENNIRADYAKLMGETEPRTVSGERVTYYFWDAQDSKLPGTQRLMIMVFQTPGRDTVQVTVAMGDSIAMDAIGANETEAREEQVAADKILRKHEANQNAGKT